MADHAHTFVERLMF